jgi:hypothetical protein
MPFSFSRTQDYKKLYTKFWSGSKSRRALVKLRRRARGSVMAISDGCAADAVRLDGLVNEYR